MSLPGPSADLADRVGQLHVHLRERLLHMLNTTREFWPYLKAAASQFSPRRVTSTERMLGKV